MNIVTALLALLGMGVVGLALAGTRTRRRLKTAHPPTGQLVDMGGYRLHLNSQGVGSPTVVIDAGAGDFSASWALVQPEVATFTRVVAYDRAGLGWSDASPRPRTTEVMVDELHTLLQRAEISGPYVLVGASLGGMLARLYAHTYPDEVAGIVFVDASHEEQFSPAPIQEALQKMSWMMPVMNGALSMLVRSGLAALKPSLLPDYVGLNKLPAPAAESYRAVLSSDSKHLTAQSAELRALDTSHEQMRKAHITTLGDIPIIVLRHGKPQPQMALPEVSQLLEETFVELQHELAALSSNGRMIVAEESGHAIQIDQPDLVVSAIREVVMAARERMPAPPTPVADVA